MTKMKSRNNQQRNIKLFKLIIFRILLVVFLEAQKNTTQLKFQIDLKNTKKIKRNSNIIQDQIKKES